MDLFFFFCVGNFNDIKFEVPTCFDYDLCSPEIVQRMQALCSTRAPLGPVRVLEFGPCDNALALQFEHLFRQSVAIGRDVFTSAIIGGVLLVIAGFMHGTRFLPINRYDAGCHNHAVFGGRGVVCGILRRHWWQT